MSKIRIHTLWRRTCFIAGFSAITGTLTAQSVLPDSLQHKDTVAFVETHLLAIPRAEQVGAISSVSGRELYKTPTANLSNTLYGLLPGLTVMQGLGEPGYDEASLAIRGIGSYSGGTYAIFVDGFQTTWAYFQYLSPTEIATVNVLKDAVSLASLGMKGANGAIWVTTKRGSNSKPAVRIQSRTGAQQAIRINKPLDAFGYATLYNEANSNDNGNVWTPVYSASDLESYRNGSGTNVDWYDAILKNQTPFTTTDVSFMGGNDIVRYFVTTGYMTSNGLYDVQNDDTHSNARLRQFNLRANVDFNAFDIFEGKIDMGGRTEDRRFPNQNGNTLWRNMATYPNNVYPVSNPDGSWTGTITHPQNPVASLKAIGYNSTHDRTLQANFTLKEKLDFITKGLYLRQALSLSTWTRGSYDVTRNYARYINGQRQTPDVDEDYEINDDYGTVQWSYTHWFAEAGYETSVGRSRLHAVINYLQSGFKNDAVSNGLAGINTIYNNHNLSVRAHYSYNEKYLAELAMAYSGSDNFAPGNRFGFYPAVGLGWLLHKEAFLSGNTNIHFFKLRASAGLVGYDGAVGSQRYLYKLYYGNKGSYPTGNGTPTWHSGTSELYTPNEAIFAEKSLKYNLGVDLGLFSKLDITLDGFIDNRSGIVTPDNALLAVFGTTPPLSNIGKVQSKGGELTLQYHDKVGDFGYNIGAMASYSINRIEYMAEVTPATPNIARTGRAIGTRFGYDFIGFYDVSDFDNTGQLVSGIAVPSFGSVQPGDLRYRDVNGDGYIDQRDMVEIGKPYLPNLTYAFNLGFNYKNVDLSILLQGVSGRTVNLLDASEQVLAFNNFGNVYAIANGRWAYYPDQGIDTRSTATYPRLSTANNINNYQSSTLWTKPADFLRLRNIELGYNLPSKLLGRAGFRDARIYVSGVNLLTISKLTDKYGMDPETLSGYPGLKSYNIGLTFSF
ncbi:MAG: SusC/RagA family TonB-linked outer membrane protein [Niabella sp.]